MARWMKIVLSIGWSLLSFFLMFMCSAGLLGILFAVQEAVHDEVLQKEPSPDGSRHLVVYHYPDAPFFEPNDRIAVYVQYEGFGLFERLIFEGWVPYQRSVEKYVSWECDRIVKVKALAERQGLEMDEVTLRIGFWGVRRIAEKRLEEPGS